MAGAVVVNNIEIRKKKYCYIDKNLQDTDILRTVIFGNILYVIINHSD